jgi:uncharacterized membrane protein YcaP (DUF421 family)
VESVLRGAAVFLFVWLLFRLSGKRSLAQVTTFDFMLLVIISETTTSALVGEDYSITNAVLLILTLVGLDVGLSLWKKRSPGVARVLDGSPVVLVEHGRPLQERLDEAGVDTADVLTAARVEQGLERLDQIKYAVLERNGTISVVPDRGR